MLYFHPINRQHRTNRVILCRVNLYAFHMRHSFYLLRKLLFIALFEQIHGSASRERQAIKIRYSFNRKYHISWLVNATFFNFGF